MYKKKCSTIEPLAIIYLLRDDVDVFLSSVLVLVLVVLGADVIAAGEEVTLAKEGDEVVVSSVGAEADVEEEEDNEEEEEAGRVLVTSVLGPFPPLAQ
jgi:hypothetical protein